MTPGEAVVEPGCQDQGIKDVPETRDLGLVEEGRQFEEMRDFMSGIKIENAELHSACATENAACTKRRLEVSAPQVEKAVRKKRTKEMTRRLAEKLSVREKMRRTESAHVGRRGCRKKADRASRAVVSLRD